MGKKKESIGETAQKRGGKGLVTLRNREKNPGKLRSGNKKVSLAEGGEKKKKTEPRDGQNICRDRSFDQTSRKLREKVEADWRENKDSPVKITS